MRRRRLRKWLLVVAIFIVALGAVLSILAIRATPMFRAWAIEALRERYKADVQLGSLTLSYFPIVRVTGDHLALAQRDRPGLPPLVSVRHFSVTADWRGLLGQPRRFHSVKLQGLEINIPPRRDVKWPGPVQHYRPQAVTPFVINQVTADGAVLQVFPKQAGKLPRVFRIAKLRLHSAGVGQPMTFQATLANPTPPGNVETLGHFGPWRANEPSQTAVSGTYTFRHADLSVFHDLSGILASDGAYGGILERIAVDGTTDIPEFTVGLSGNPVHLKTTFHAIVDGTNGDTILDPVEAQWMNTSITCRGGVVGLAQLQGKEILLEVVSENARLEDLLRLAVKSAAVPLTGRASLKTTFELPPGSGHVMRRLRLNGSFSIRQARFTNPNVEAKIESLSRHGRGYGAVTPPTGVASNMVGRFILNDEVMAFPNLSFAVRGATVRLTGTYGLASEQLNFAGTLALQAKVSQMTHGIKSVLLRPIDPLFSREGAGTVLPIVITGTRQQPDFRVNVRKIFSRFH